MAAVRRDWRTAPITGAERVMLEYVEKLTLAPATVQRNDLQQLHAAGFDDVAVSQITMIAAFFAYVNRVADGLGVGRP